MLDRIAERIDWDEAVRPRQRHAAARARARRRLQGGDRADHLGRHRQHRRRRQLHALSAAPSTWARAPTPPWRRWSPRCSTWRRRRSASCRATPTSRPTTWARSARARCSTWATRCGSPPKTPRPRSRRMAREVGEPEGSNIPLAELFRKKYGMQAGNIVGTGTYKPDYVPPDPPTGQTPNATPFWMVGGSGAEVEVDTETGHCAILRLVNVVDCRHPDQSEDRRDADFRRRDDAARLHPVREDASSTAARSPMPRSPTTRSPASTTCRRRWRTRRSRPIRRTGRSAPRASASSRTFGVSPAIANAIDDAVGVRLTELPLTRGSRVPRAARQSNKPLGGRMT